MTDAILEHGGTLVSYMGDGIMAVFGAPIEQADHADRALRRRARDARPALERFNAWLAEPRLGDEFRMGVGLNSGPVMVGQRRLRAAHRVHGDRRHDEHRVAPGVDDEGHAVRAHALRGDPRADAGAAVPPGRARRGRGPRPQRQAAGLGPAGEKCGKPHGRARRGALGSPFGADGTGAEGAKRMSLKTTITITLTLAAALLPAAAMADTGAGCGVDPSPGSEVIDGDALNVCITPDGALGARLENAPGGEFFATGDPVGTAGFGLAFPDFATASGGYVVTGWNREFAPDAQDAPQSAGAVTTQQTRYHVDGPAGDTAPLVEVTQTVTYTAGRRAVRVDHTVHSLRASALRVRAFELGNVSVGSDDAGPTFLEAGAPRYLAGRTRDRRRRHRRAARGHAVDAVLRRRRRDARHRDPRDGRAPA